MPKVRMQLELNVVPRNPNGAADLSDVEDKILNGLLEYFNDLPPKSNWLATSIKITNVENKKYGILWKRLK